MDGSLMGEIRLIATDRAPVGWLKCDGSLVNISQYPGLFSMIGTTYGGDGVRQFALPDLRGRLPIGQRAATAAQPAYLLAETGGQQTTTLTALPPHSHDFMVTTDAATTTLPDGAVPAVPPQPFQTFVPQSATAGSVALSASMLTYVGGNQPHDNMMPSMPMAYIISVAGSMPQTMPEGGA